MSATSSIAHKYGSFASLNKTGSGGKICNHWCGGVSEEGERSHGWPARVSLPWAPSKHAIAQLVAHHVVNVVVVVVVGARAPRFSLLQRVLI